MEIRLTLFHRVIVGSNKREAEFAQQIIWLVGCVKQLLKLWAETSFYLGGWQRHSVVPAHEEGVLQLNFLFDVKLIQHIARNSQYFYLLSSPPFSVRFKADCKKQCGRVA